MFNCFQAAPKKNSTTLATVSEKKQFSQLKQSITDNLIKICNQAIVCDPPNKNENGLIDYKYTIERDANRKRRIAAARKFDLTMSDAPFSHDFFNELVCQVLSCQSLFGQCAELAMVAAKKIKNLAELEGLKVYLIQIPDFNHTVVLLSKNTYNSKQFVNWKQEYIKHSIIVDLWQAVLTPDYPDALVSLAESNLYTNKKPKVFVQLKV